MTREASMRWILQAGIDDGDREVMADCLREALRILDSCELVEDYPGGDATHKSSWRSVPDDQEASS